MASVTGIVLAAGAGSRFGGPKALARTPDGAPWLHRVAAALREGGCDDLLIVLGAEAAAASPLVPLGARTVVAVDWAEGLSRSLRAGLEAAHDTDAVLVVPVDVPELPTAAVARVLARAGDHLPEALARAVYGGRPGHPALIGAAHFSRLTERLEADTGAGPYLAAHGARAIECGDLWSGQDHDTPDPVG